MSQNQEQSEHPLIKQTCSRAVYIPLPLKLSTQAQIEEAQNIATSWGWEPAPDWAKQAKE